MQDSPKAPELLDAIQDLLMKEVLPALEGNDGLAYKTLVSWNMLGVVSREMRQGEALVTENLERFRTLLSSELKPAESLPEKQAQMRELNSQLAEKIRKEKISTENADVMDALKAAVRAKLAVANPRFTQD